MQVRHAIAAAVLLAVGAPALQAQQTDSTTPPAAAPATNTAPATTTTPAAPTARRVGVVLGLQIGSMAIDPASATRAEVGDRSYGLQLDAGALIARHYYLGIDIGGQFLDDNAQFTQNTTGGKMKSTAAVTYFSAIAGLRTGTLAVLPLSAALNVGASLTTSRRSIDNCTDCHVDKLDIPGGAFAEPTLLFGRGNVRLRLTDRVYFGGEGMRNVMSLGMDLQTKWK